MIEPEAFHRALKDQGYDFFTGVPDSLLKHLCAYIADRVPRDRHVINANEGSAIGLAAGYHLATGEVPVVYMQNSGLGNAVNPLLSLADSAVYGIPILMLVGWRGEPGRADEPQHVTQGRITRDLLDTMGVEHHVIGPDTEDFDVVVADTTARIRATSRPCALLIRDGSFAPYTPEGSAERPYPLTRADVLEVVLDAIPPDVLVVSTTGMTSREVYAIRQRRGLDQSRDFLTVGSMGHASQIALGVAMRHADRQVLCLDGDGAVIMHMGSLAIIGSLQATNFKHVLINNGAHDSVGGQPTAAASVDFCAVASACGYTTARRAVTLEEVSAAIRALIELPGPALLELPTRSTATTDAGRPSTTPAQNKARFMTAFNR
jgi:phosphonopyruvate decarboxylase